MSSLSANPPDAEKVTETVELADLLVTPTAYPLPYGVHLTEVEYRGYRQFLAEPGPCTVYPFYDKTVAIKIVSGEYLWGQRHNHVVIRYTPENNTPYSHTVHQLI